MDYLALVSEVLDDYLNVRPGDAVWIDSWDHTLDLASALGSECGRRGCPHMMTVRYEDTWLRSISDLPKEQLKGVSPQMKAALAKTDFLRLANPFLISTCSAIRTEMSSSNSILRGLTVVTPDWADLSRIKTTKEKEDEGWMKDTTAVPRGR